MIMKSIEIYYNIADIPGVTGKVPSQGIPGAEQADLAFDFRNEAMELIETALDAADAGEWEGAEIGMGEVNFGFSVDDFDTAESIVRKAVSGTKFEKIREISRSAFDTESEQFVDLH